MNPLYNLRHSLAHLLAQAVLRSIDPHAVLGTGPAIDDGCYYDIGLSTDVHFGDGDFSNLTKLIQGIAKEQQFFVSYTTTDIDEALAICDLMSQPLKKELIAKFHANGETSYSFRANSVNAQMKPRIVSQSSETYMVRQDALTQYFISKEAI
jgi:threonyl-tRNA synthetase